MKNEQLNQQELNSLDLIKKRMSKNNEQLLEAVNQLNKEREKAFTREKLELLATLPIKSELISSPCDMISDKDHIITGYSINKGLSVVLSDVFTYHKIENEDLIESDINHSFLNDQKFSDELVRLYRFYAEIQFKQFLKTADSIIVVFNYSKNPTDIKSYKWTLNREKEYCYKGETSIEEVQGLLNVHTHDWKDINPKNLTEKKIKLNDETFIFYVNNEIVFQNKNKILFKEALKERNQSFDDMQFALSAVGELVLVKYTPYGEKSRYYLFDPINLNVFRCDDLDKSVVELPQNNGILFCNGYYLNKGEFKVFDKDLNANYLKTIRSPNGEDTLYIFYNNVLNNYLLYTYNLVDQECTAPIKAHGFSLTDKGELLLVKDSAQMSKNHNVQVWGSAFYTEEVFNEKQKLKEVTRVEKIGNNELVKAISSIKNIVSFIETKEVSFEVYLNIIKMINEILDVYHWLGVFNDLNLTKYLNEEKVTAELVLGEFKKVEDLKIFSEEKLRKLTEHAEEVFTKAKVRQGDITYMMSMLVEVKKLTGEVSSLKEERYIDQEKVDILFKRTEVCYNSINKVLATLLNEERTYTDINNNIKELKVKLDKESSYKEIININKEIETISSNIGLLNEEVSALTFEDNRVLSEILEKIAQIFSTINQVSAIGKNKENKIALEEAKVEFGSQSKLLEQTVKNSLMKSTTLDKTDEEYAKVLALLQELETRFSHIGGDNFSELIEEQKNDINTAFAAHEKKLRNDLQEKIDQLKKAIEISLKTISSKVEKSQTLNELSTLFLTDGIIRRTNEMIKEIAEYGDVTSSEDYASELVKLRKTAIKRIRDDSDLFEENGAVIKLGQHRFAVNKKAFDVVLVKDQDKILSHVETTKFYKEINLGENSDQLLEHWDYDVISESKDLYRSEYLVYSILQDVKLGKNGLTQPMLDAVINKEYWQDKKYTLLDLISNYSSKLFKEGYIKGIHDLDAEKILKQIYKVYQDSSDVKFDSNEKIDALMLYAHIYKSENSSLLSEIKKGLNLINKIGSPILINNVLAKLKEDYGYDKEVDLDVLEYMVDQIETNKICSKEIDRCYKEMRVSLSEFIGDFVNDLKSENKLVVKFKVLSDLRNLMKDYCVYVNDPVELVDELLISFLRVEILGQKLEVKDFDYSIKIEGLLGNHPMIDENQTMILTIESFNRRNKWHRDHVLPLYDEVDKVRASVLKEEQDKINLTSMTAKPLASFVKNKLISQSYLPKFGANFSKQIGETGKNKRSDTMGMLLLTSPPGYGKTTLVEYIVDKLGMLFVKINCPSIGHDITSLDPNEASNLTSRKEIEKINFAFEMGDNVCLYLDDIQHTNPEFLQKFISLCDGTRTIDGVWENKSKTYNLRGRRFCVIMAGNPYTESGEVFKIPDMLANRADTYNLGEISSDDKNVFELSYIENSLTSNSVTASLMDRSSNDVYLFLKQIEGIHIDNDNFDNEYSDSEANEIRAVLKIMKRVQEIILKVNEQYIYSASQSDEYRIEPAFKLQGSYRNMSKIVEKVLPMMTEDEVNNLIIDHYQSESQTLTKSNEENLLKFKEIFGNMTDEDRARWNYLKEEFLKGNKDHDQQSIVASLRSIETSLVEIAKTKASLLFLTDSNDQEDLEQP